MVHPSDVIGPSVPGPIVLLVDCPTEFHLPELLPTQSLTDYYADSSNNPTGNGKSVTCIIHLGPASIVSTPCYQNWMKKFGSAQHIMAGHERKNVEIPILKAGARVAARLNYLCPQLFPAPGFWSLQHLNHQGPDFIASSEVASNLCESILAEHLLKFTLRPYAHLGLDRSSIPISVTPSEIINELQSDIPEIVDATNHVSKLWLSSRQSDISAMGDDKTIYEEPWLNGNNIPSCLDQIRRDDLEIVLLGTGYLNHLNTVMLVLSTSIFFREAVYYWTVGKELWDN